MIQLWTSNVVVLSGAGFFNPVSSIADMTATENNHRCPVRAPGTIRNFKLTLVDALAGGGTRTFTVRKNGVDTALVIALTGDGTTDGSDVVNSVTLSAGDELSVHQTTTFSPPSTTMYCRLEFEATVDDTTVYGSGGGGAQFDTSARYRALFCGEVGRNDSSEAANSSLASMAGTVTHLDVRLTDAPTAGKSRIFHIYKNGVLQDGAGGTVDTAITIADAATTGTRSISLSCAALDKLSLRCTSSGSPGNSGIQSSVVYVSSVGNAQHVTVTSDAALSQTLTQYNTPHGAALAWAASPRQQMGGVQTLVLQHLHAEVSAAPGSGKTWTFTLFVDDVATVLTATISNLETEVTFTADDTVLIGDGERFYIQVVPSGTPVGGSLAKVTFAVLSITPILGSAVFGAYTTVTATLAIAMGLDGAIHVDNDPNTLTVYGDLHVTGDTILDGGVDGAAGVVVGPASSTDNAIARWDGTNGDTLQDGTPTVEDDGRIANLADPSGAQDAATKAYVDGAAVGLLPSRCEGRLTLETGVPFSVTDQIGATTIYFTPYLGNHISLYSGSAWVDHTFTERSLALSGLTSGKNYDVFLYNNAGTLTLELSAAWSSDSARTDALTTQDVVLVKSGATTRRYLGTIRTTGTTTTEDSHGGTTTQVGGKRFVWNLCNALPRALRVIDTTNTWTYTSSWRQANGASGNKVEFVVGTVISYAEAVVHASIGLASNGTNAAKVAVGYDSTSTPSGMRQGAYNGNAGFIAASIGAMVNGPIPTIGYHYFSWMETGADGTTSLFYGDNNGDGIQSGLNAWITG